MLAAVVEVTKRCAFVESLLFNRKLLELNSKQNKTFKCSIRSRKTMAAIVNARTRLFILELLFLPIDDNNC